MSGFTFSPGTTTTVTTDPEKGTTDYRYENDQGFLIKTFDSNGQLLREEQGYHINDISGAESDNSTFKTFDPVSGQQASSGTKTVADDGAGRERTSITENMADGTQKNIVEDFDGTGEQGVVVTTDAKTTLPSGDTSEDKTTRTDSWDTFQGQYQEYTEHYENDKLTERSTYTTDNANDPDKGNTSRTDVKYTDDGGAVIGTKSKGSDGSTSSERTVVDKDGNPTSFPAYDDGSDIQAGHPNPLITEGSEVDPYFSTGPEPLSLKDLTGKLQLQLQTRVAALQQNLKLVDHDTAVAEIVQGISAKR